MSWECSGGKVAIDRPVLAATAHCARCQGLIDACRPMGITIGDGTGRPLFWCKACLERELDCLIKSGHLRANPANSRADFITCSRCGCNNFLGKVKNFLGRTVDGRLWVCDECAAALLH